MTLRIALALALSLTPAMLHAQSLPAPNLGSGTRLNGTPFAPSATSDTTNAANIKSGTMDAARLPKASLQANNAKADNYGADPTGVVDSTSSFVSAFGSSNIVTTNSNSVYLVKNLVLSVTQELDCGGSTLRAAAGSSWVVKKTGFNSRIHNCVIDDTSNFTRSITTLAATAAPGATAIIVSSAAGMSVGQVAVIALDSGAPHVSKITSVSGTTIGIADPVPASATAASVSGGGTACVQGDPLIVQGGVGAPATLLASAVSAGAITAVTVQVPGLYSTAPAAATAAFDPKVFPTACTGAAVSLTTSGAASGNAVTAAYGSLWSDQANQGTADNIVFSNVPVAIQVSNSSGGSSAYEEAFSNIKINNASMVAVFHDVGVNNAKLTNVQAYGNSFAGAVGLYVNADSPGASPPGGNVFTNITLLGFKIGVLQNAAQLNKFNGIISDGSKYYGFVLNGVTNTTFGAGTSATFTGPAANLGVGFYFGASASGALTTNIVMDGLYSNNNAVDLATDSLGTSGLWLGDRAWGPSKVWTGNSLALQSVGTVSYAMSTAAVGGNGATIFLGGFGSAATETAFWVAPKKGPVVKFRCEGSAAPGAGQTNTCTLRRKGVSTFAACSWTGTAAFGCAFTGPGAVLLDDDTFDIQVTSSATAAAAQFRAYVNQM